MYFWPSKLWRVFKKGSNVVQKRENGKNKYFTEYSWSSVLTLLRRIDLEWFLSQELSGMKRRYGLVRSCCRHLKAGKEFEKKFELLNITEKYTATRLYISSVKNGVHSWIGLQKYQGCSTKKSNESLKCSVQSSSLTHSWHYRTF